MKRFQDWALRLSDCLEAKKVEPFVWGKNDCALFAADCVLAQTGVDLGAAWRGTYDSAEGCLQAIKAKGLITLEGIVTAALGDPLPFPSYASRGDVALVPMAGTALGFEQSVGIVVGDTVAVPALPHGFAFIRSARIIKAWKI